MQLDKNTSPTTYYERMIKLAIKYNLQLHHNPGGAAFESQDRKFCQISLCPGSEEEDYHILCNFIENMDK